ncbi:MAG: endonuclease/exonuclease/phosphatase family protein [Leptospiraceae bacterium]|nr:endonuclease/exonuclease/phosphatase family protein [Leptospiraceae bacterium]
MSLRIVTYNIHKGIGNDGKFNLDRTIRLLHESDADVICLQEVDHDVPRSGHQNLAAVIAGELQMEFRLEVNVRLKHGAYGNATLTRLQIQDSKNLDLTWRIKKKRGSLVTRLLDAEKREFLVYNIHLGLAAFERSWQLHRLLTSDFHREYHDNAILIAGDTNDSRHRLNQMVEVGGFKDTCQTRLQRSNFSFPAYAPVIRIDKIYYNKYWKLLKHHVMQGSLARITSDHRPVWADLELLAGKADS